MTEDTKITLNFTNSINIIVQYIELCQKSGAYSLQEAEIVKRAIDVVLKGTADDQITKNSGVDILIQSILRGQKSGCFTLNDASLLFNIVKYVKENIENGLNELVPLASGSENIKSIVTRDTSEDTDEDLSELCQPIPLRPIEL